MNNTTKGLRLLFLVCCLGSMGEAYAQTMLGQFWNEFQFSRALKGKWALETNIGQTYTSTATHQSLFSESAQVYGRVWAHYYLNSRVKLSAFGAYFYNRAVPEISQRSAPEVRTALQGTYFLHKVRYTLSTRLRIEDRYIQNDSGHFENVFRFRGQLKLLYPLNGKFIRQGVVYGIASDEIMVKTASNIAGRQFFDRNRLTLGAGYSITDDIQVEITYANEFLPRPKGNEIYNALQLNVAFNNLWPNLRKKLFHPHPQQPDEEN